MTSHLESQEFKSPSTAAADSKDALKQGVDRTLTKIESRMSDVTQSAKNMMDDTVEYVRDHGGPYYDRIGRIVTNHPLPLATIGIGLLWLAASTARGTTSTTRRSSSAYGGGPELSRSYEGQLYGDRRTRRRPGGRPLAPFRALRQRPREGHCGFCRAFSKGGRTLTEGGGSLAEGDDQGD